MRAGSRHLSPQISINENLIYSVTPGVGRVPETKCLPALVLRIFCHKCQGPGRILLCLTISLGFIFYLQSFTENKKAKCISYMACCTSEPLLQHLWVCSSWHCCAHTPAVTTSCAFALEILVEESPESRVVLGEEAEGKGALLNRLSLQLSLGTTVSEWI